MLVHEQTNKDIEDGEELLKIFKEADLDKSDSISLSEFRMLADHPKFMSFLKVRGISINNVKIFYQMLCTCSGDEAIDTQTCVNACLRLKGFATSIDLHSLNFEVKLLHKQQAQCFKAFDSKMQRLEGLVSALNSLN